MQFLQLSLLYLAIEDKTELSDCYNASSYIRLVTIRSKRYYRLYLTPTGKEECYQIPRGINVTVFANALVDANGDFVPTSFIVVNFSYATTIGINIRCLNCVDDTYLASDQVIITMESAIHFTRVVMGSVLTEKGLQVNCFQSSRTTVDIDYIQLQVSNSQNCPQLISSANSNNMKNLVSADVFIVYLNGDIDRYEKLVIGTDFKTLRNPPSWGSTNTFNATVPNIGLKPLSSSIQFIQFQLYFESTGATIMTSIQVNNYTVIQLQKAYSSIQFKVQGASAYLDLVANTTVLSSGLQVFQDYNNQITALQADSVQIQFFGYSSRIPTTYVLDGTQVTSSVENYYQEPSMSFTMKTSTFQFSTGRTRMQCKNLLESDCEANLKRYLATNDSTYQFNMIIRFFKNGQMIKVMNQNVGAATESCFNEAVIKVEKQTLNIELGQAVSQCSLSGQKVNLVLNMSQTNLDTLATTYQQFNSSVDFAYSYTIPLSTEQFSNLESYVLSPNSELSQMLMVYVEDVLMDYVSIDQLYISQEDQFKQEAKNLVVVVGIVSIIICVCQILAPLVIRKIAPIIQQRKQLKMKVHITNNDDM
ncbi:Hypothetical_protein [Hexamita inflata]|uniref:Hypothetical_protein n=1 Tax=Hexamita inflata TaxID=28002 RepID=A0AA86QHI0_9EUKA|nr:Hypothetical protein HINF_LOCUS47091 [Hexamita inflata]CAI9959447.1 Hypothetical protein HINF_LOCUS47092 [Hexamita inflata]